MLMGDAAQDVDADFDLYWNSLSAYHELLVQPDPGIVAIAGKSDAEAIVLRLNGVCIWGHPKQQADH